MKLFTTAALILMASPTLASTPLPATLTDLARGADHILVGRVVGVDMVDDNCRSVTDRDARTGPGLTNIIRLHIAVDEVLLTNAESVPRVLKVPLDPFMHYTLNQIRAAHAGSSESRLVLLAGPAFQPIIPGAFLRPVDEKEEALRIHRESHPARRSRSRSERSPASAAKQQKTCD